jgi:hypothetical protein
VRSRVGMTASAAPFQPPLCRCDRPLLAEETCLRCGRPLALTPEPAARAARARRDTAWTRPQVIRAFQAFTFFRGRPPVVADWNGRMADWPPRETVEAMFGSVEAAARAAGVEPRP